MWGRGRSAAAGQALEIEQKIIDKYATLADGLEHAGLKQERRDLVSKPQALTWQWLQEGEQAELLMSFSLNAGHYATSVLKDRKSTRLNSSHVRISYAVFCLKKKKKQY